MATFGSKQFINELPYPGWRDPDRLPDFPFDDLGAVSSVAVLTDEERMLAAKFKTIKAEGHVTREFTSRSERADRFDRLKVDCANGIHKLRMMGGGVWKCRKCREEFSNG